MNRIKKTGELPRRALRRIPFRKILCTISFSTYFLMLNTQTIMAAAMWAKADTVALLLMNFSKSGKTVDESRAWLKRIAISWVILNGLGFIMAYVTPFFSDGRWNG